MITDFKMMVDELLHYSPSTGIFTWKVSPRANIKSGAVAGMRNHDGYVVIKIKSRGYLAHRLAWFVHRGEWPCGELDHRDGDPANNAINNLRPATRTQNTQNNRIRKDSISGRKGVTRHKGLWYSQIQSNKKRLYLGSFVLLEDAAKAYEDKARELFGEFYRASA